MLSDPKYNYPQPQQKTSFGKIFAAALLAIVVSWILFFVFFIGAGVSIVSGLEDEGNEQLESKLKDNPFLVIETDQRFSEQGSNNPFGMLFGDNDNYSTGLFEATRALEAAAKDDHIKGIFLELKGSPNGWATTEQLRNALLAFKKSGKPIYAYGESISQKDYYLATAADSIFLNPAGMMELKGLAAQLTFFKGTLDKLELQPEIFYAGKFKSATEPFRTDRMSEPNRQQLTAILNQYWANIKTAAATKSGKDTTAVQAFANTIAIGFPEDFRRAGLIAGALYRDEVVDIIRRKLSIKEDKKETPSISLNDYSNNGKRGRPDGKNRIALLFAEGEIVDGDGGDEQIASEEMVKTIRSIRNNKDIKACVLRVNSPGGSALASEVILRELQLLQQKMPLVVSMGDVAASGGYYIACSADSIFAMPTTMTGSIGVFSMMFDISGLAKNKLGITFDAVKTAQYADFPASHRPLTDVERIRMQAVVDTIYNTFKSRVAAGRHMNAAMVDSIAQGRVWTGTDALRIGLVDGLGGIDRALQAAAAKAKLGSDYKVSTYPEKGDLLAKTLSRFRRMPLSEADMKRAIAKEIGIEEMEALRQLQWLKTMRGKAMMYMPLQVEIR